MAVQNAMFVACAAHVFEVSGYLRCSEKMNFQFLYGLQLIALSLYRLGCTYRHINNYTEQCVSWEATITLDLPENQNVLWDSNCCFQVHVPILRQMCWAMTSYFLVWGHFFHLFLDLPCHLFPWGFPPNSRYSFEYMWIVYVCWPYSFLMICQ